MFFLFLICALHIGAAVITAGRLFRPHNRIEHLLQAGLIAYCTFYLVPITVGWVTGYMNGFVLATGVLIAVGCAAYACIKLPAYSRAVWLQGSLLRRAPVEYVIWITGAALLLLLLLAGLVYPARYADAPAYHMANPMRWHQTGRFILDSFGSLELSAQLAQAEFAPNVKGIWPFAVMLFTADTPATALTQFPFLLIMLAAIRAIALRLGAKPWLASFAALITMAVPELVLQSVEEYADVVFACGEIVVIWTLLFLWQERFSWRSVVLSGDRVCHCVWGEVGSTGFRICSWPDLRDSANVEIVAIRPVENPEVDWNCLGCYLYRDRL